MSNQPTTAHIIETGASAYAVAIDVSGHALTGDEPADAGGKNLGPAPYDLLTAALGECTAMTVRWYALQQQWPVEKVQVTVLHHKDGKRDVFTKTLNITGSQLTDAQRQKLHEIAGKCPVQRTMEGTPVITTAWAGIG